MKRGLKMENIFDSEYCRVEYKEVDNVVLLTWKQFACFENYRAPSNFALQLLKEYTDSQLIVDARNGFEDEKEDVEWGFKVFLPALAQTGCKQISFIMNEVNEIEEEMDMWTKEVGKYVAVYRANSYENALYKMRNML